jgi:eukaryotic-like serine/threonine-protein kinase
MADSTEHTRADERYHAPEGSTERAEYPTMRICPACQTSYDGAVARCANDGRRLLTVRAFERSMDDALIGTVLADRYDILDRLGVGGMGTVYRAEQRALGRDVAVKVLRRELGRDADTVARFHREAKALSNLRHPNTVAVLDFGQTRDGLLFLVMELLEGEMLSTRLRRVGALPIADALRITAGMLRSLGEAHRLGIVHRDLKPDNIFLARVDATDGGGGEELVKVVDFGVAKIRPGGEDAPIDPLSTQEGTVFGTPRYMSPEQAQGRALDGRSDLYAVGVMLFQMLCGAVPFGEDDAVVVMAHHIMTAPPRMRDVNPAVEVPAALDALVASALKKRPDDRPESAEAFLRSIEALPIDGARSGITSGPFAGAARPTRARAARAAWVLAATLGLGIAVFTALPARHPASLDAAARPVTARAPAPPPPEPLAPPAPSPLLSPEPAPIYTGASYVSPDLPPIPMRRARHRHSRRHARPIRPTVSVTSTSAPAAPAHAPYPRWSD